MSSQSKEKFDERIQEIKILQRTIPEPKLLATEEIRNLEKAIHRASLVMLCGHVQGYIEDALEEFLDRLRSNRVSSGKIPPELKVALCKPDLITLKNDDYNILVQRIPQFIRRYEGIWCSMREIPPEEFPEIETRDWRMGNPWPNTLEMYLKRIGIEELWDDSSRTLKSDLNTVVEKRNLIAHGHFDATATNEDIRRYIESMQELIQRIDIMIETHLNNIMKN